MRYNRTTILFGFLLLLTPLARQASAFPAFARKYNLPCARCHTMVPRLTPFGYAFFRAGFRMPNNQQKSITLENSMSVITQVNVATGQPAFSVPGVDGVFSSSLSKQLSALVRYTMATDTGSSSGFDDLLVQYNSRAKSPFWSISVGQIAIIDGYQLLGDRTFTITDAMMFGGNGPLKGASPGNFSVGMGMLERGVEAGYTDGGINARVSWLNGVDESGAGNISLPGNRFHDFVLQAEDLIGNEGTALGGFYYNGKTPLVSVGYNDNFQRAGLFGTYARNLIAGQRGIPFLHVELNGGVLWGQDTVSDTGAAANSTGALLEADLYFQNRTALAIRYDSVLPSNAAGNPVTEAWTYDLMQRANNNLQIGFEYRKQRQPNLDTMGVQFLVTY